MAKRPLNTACGPANAAALERLQESFETQRLLDAVDQINHVAARVEDACFRQDLLRLHAMAHTLINGAPPTMSGQETIWKLAGGLAVELEEMVDDLQSTLGLLRQLAELVPEDAPRARPT